MLGAAVAAAALIVVVVQDRRGVEIEAQGDPDRGVDHRQRALGREALADEQKAAGAHTLAESALKEAVDDWSRVIAADPSRVDDRLRLVKALLRLGHWIENEGRWEEAERIFHRGSLACLALPIVSQGDPRISRLLARVLDRHGGILVSMGRLAEAIKSRETAAAAARSVVESPARVPDDVRRLIVVLIHWAETLEEAGRVADVAAPLEEALRASSSRDARSTPTGDDLELTAQVLDRLARLRLARPDDSVKVRGLIEKALRLREQRVLLLGAADKTPADSLDQALARLADNETALARMLVQEGAVDRALRLARSALDHQSHRTAHVESARMDLGRALIDLAQTQRARGDLAGALTHARRGALLLGALHREDRVDSARRLAASLAWWTVCDLELAVGDHRAAARAVAAYLKIEPAGYDEALESGRFLCRCAGFAGADAALADAYARSALAALSTAVKRGFRGRDELTKSPHYATLRTYPEFDRILADLVELDERS